ncbi:hypothetical protein ACLB2K_037630 [Fragaria x ananassa]
MASLSWISIAFLVIFAFATNILAQWDRSAAAAPAATIYPQGGEGSLKPERMFGAVSLQLGTQISSPLPPIDFAFALPPVFLSSPSDFSWAPALQRIMTRGNQREKDRERAAARAKASKNKDDGLTPEQRRERDAKALQEKLAKKADKSAGAAGANSSSGGKSK